MGMYSFNKRASPTQSGVNSYLVEFDRGANFGATHSTLTKASSSPTKQIVKNCERPTRLLARSKSPHADPSILGKLLLDRPAEWPSCL